MHSSTFFAAAAAAVVAMVPSVSAGDSFNGAFDGIPDAADIAGETKNLGEKIKSAVSAQLEHVTGAGGWGHGHAGSSNSYQTVSGYGNGGDSYGGHEYTHTGGYSYPTTTEEGYHSKSTPYHSHPYHHTSESYHHTTQPYHSSHHYVSSSSLSYHTTTEIVDHYTTYCPEPTTVTLGTKTYTVTEPTTLTVTDCPCTVVKTTTETQAQPTPTPETQIETVTRAPAPTPTPETMVTSARKQTGSIGTTSVFVPSQPPVQPTQNIPTAGASSDKKAAFASVVALFGAAFVGMVAL